MHFAIFSRLSSYGNYSVRVEVLKPALNQQNYLRASLSTQVKVGRKAEEISITTFSPFFSTFQHVSGAPEYSDCCLSLRPLDLFDRRGLGLLNNFARRLGKAAQVNSDIYHHHICILITRVFTLINCQLFNSLKHGGNK